MPSRVIRDGLLDSPAWHSVSAEAKVFFVALLLLADDFGLISLASVFIGRHAFERRPSETRLQKLIDELVRADLLRVYWSGPSDSPSRFGFLPRFRQKLRQMKARHPMPPHELYADDLDAEGKFISNKELFQKMPAGRLQPAGDMRTSCPLNRSETKGNEVDLESETKRSDLRLPETASGTETASPQPPAAPRSNSFFENTKIKGAIRGPDWWAKHLKLRNQREGESVGEYIEFVEIQARQHQRGSA